MKTYMVTYNVKFKANTEPMKMKVKVDAKNEMEAIGIAVQSFFSLEKNRELSVNSFTAKEA